MILKPGPYNEPEEGEVQDFLDQNEIEPRLNYNDVIINLIII